MAKKDKKKKDKQKGSDAADAVEAVRSAVERTFQATTEGAAGTSKRTRALVDEVANAASRIRETIEDLKILEDVRGLRAEIEGLARRVAALEIRGGASDRARASRRASARHASRRQPTGQARRRRARRPKRAAKREGEAGCRQDPREAAARQAPARSRAPRRRRAKPAGSSSS